MSRKEREWLVELRQVVEGKERLKDAQGKLGGSYRNAKRRLRRYRAEGDAGLCHRSRGRPSNRRKAPEVRRAVIEMCREEFAGWGPTLVAEKLPERGYEVDHETLRRWLQAEGLWRRSRKRGPRRRRRERKAHFGELVQIDGSPFDWLGTGRQICLMDMVDDATGRGVMRLFEHETTEAAMVVTRRWVERHGVPCALYSDRHAIYHTGREPSLEELGRGEKPLTAFGRACAKLGIGIIPAGSPQAKGRVERRNGVLQDRLAKELQWRGVRTIEEANAFLEGGYMEALDERLQKEPESPVDYHRRLPKGTDLDSVFAFEEVRKVSNDWTVRYRNRLLQITGPARSAPPAQGAVLVQERLDGTLRLYYRGRAVTFEPIPSRPVPPKAPEPARKARKPPAPSQDHPWRDFRFGRRRAHVEAP